MNQANCCVCALPVGWEHVERQGLDADNRHWQNSFKKKASRFSGTHVSILIQTNGGLKGQVTPSKQILFEKCRIMMHGIVYEN